tara:strand:+ start:501 stop:1307 length:807 start_codon:yes stop_codon:yes gene_type:complete
MKRIILGLFSFTFISNIQVSAQQSVIEIASDVTMLCNCSQVEDGDTVKYKYLVTNTGNSAMLVPYYYNNGNGYTLVGTFDSKTRVTNQSFPTTSVAYSWINDDEMGVQMSIVDPNSKQAISYIYPGDTAAIVIYDRVIMSSRHKEGNNTIVVWPENYDGLTVKDSLTYNIEVLNTSGQGAANGTYSPWLSNTKVYPNPASNKVLISVPEELKTQLTEITISNAYGQTVKRFDASYLELQIGDLANGHYTVGFTLNNSTSFVKPLVVKK